MKLKSVLVNHPKKENKKFEHTTTPLIFDLSHGAFLPPIQWSRDVPNKARFLKVGAPKLNGSSGETQAGGLELVVSEISKGIESQRIRRIGYSIVLSNKGVVVFKDFKPVRIFFLGWVTFSMLMTPSFKYLGDMGRRSSSRRKVKEKKERQEKGRQKRFHCFLFEKKKGGDLGFLNGLYYLFGLKSPRNMGNQRGIENMAFLQWVSKLSETTTPSFVIFASSGKKESKITWHG